MYVVVRQVMYPHAQWYVLCEGLSVDHIVKHSNHLKRTLIMFLNGSLRFGYYLTFNLLTTTLVPRQ